MFVEYTFFPVGQGLFSCGMLYTIPQHKPFVWIYDCGSQNKAENLKTAIQQLDDISELDLVAISHFDADHINGLQTLLSKKKVKILMLPLLTAEQKCVELLFYCSDILKRRYDINDCLNDDAINFLRAPADFLENIIGDFDSEHKTAILFVPSYSYSEKGWEEYSEEGISYKYKKDSSQNVKRVICRVFDSHTPIIINESWEFFSYNDIDAVENLFQETDKCKADQNLNKIIDEIKKDFQDFKRRRQKKCFKNFDRSI